MYNRNKHDVIYNNIFGNLNPNTPSVYPKYQHIKNYVYDINIQDVQKNINRCNHRMYNAYLNNNYDTYPTESEYREQMEKNNQKYIEYAGGPPIRENTCYIKNAPRMIDIQNGNYLNNPSKLNYSMNVNNTVGNNTNNNLIYSQSINNKFVPNYNIIKSNTSQLDRSFGGIPSGSVSQASTLNSRYNEQQKIPEMA